MIFDLDGFGSTLLLGTLMTIALAIASLALGLALGLLGALGKTSASRPLRWIAEGYSTIVRGIPELIWVLLIYYGTVTALNAFGALFGRPNLALNPFLAGTLALGLCFGAYATEVFRGALLAIPRGHREAGQALGLSSSRIFFRLILPQMWRIALPGLGNLFLILMKDTALVSVIGLTEIMRQSQIAISFTKQPFTFYLCAAGLYLLLTVVTMGIMHRLEKRSARGFTRAQQ